VGAAIFATDAADQEEGMSGAAPRAGDSLWWYAGAATGWRGRRIAVSDSVDAPCPLTSTASRSVRRVVVSDPDSIPYGAALRVTRAARYAFYRSGDGSWQLGLRDWSDATSRFAAPQPIAGPFLMRTRSPHTGFRYFTSNGTELLGDDLRTSGDRLALVRMTVLTLDRGGGMGRDSVRIDSIDVALQGTRGR
jgi:hypothetical protein